MAVNKKALSEEDIKMKYITPAIIDAGWDLEKQIRAEYFFTDGRVIVRGNVTSRGKRKRADYILFYKPNLPIAIIEAKDNNYSLGSGMQQGIAYAEILDIPFVYSSNGDGFLEHDMKNGTETEIALSNFPAPEDLWRRLKAIENIDDKQAEIITEPYFFQPGDKNPAIIKGLLLTEQLKLLPKDRTGFYWSWPPEQVKPIRLFKLCTAFGKQG